MKKCKSCQSEIDDKAKKCPKCQADQRNWFMKHKIITIFLAFILIGAISSGGSKEKTQSEKINNTDATPTAEAKKLSIGDDGFLRLPNTSDKDQVILLAVEKSGSDELTKANMANDTYGLLDLAKKGAIFGVGNGTKIKVIETATFLRKVRIMEVSREVDNDKVGLAGWVPMEWVTAN